MRKQGVRENFCLLRGTPREYTKVGDSGNPRVMAFCGNCGTQLYGTGIGEHAGVLSLCMGTCTQRADLTPRREIWRRAAVHWLEELGVGESFQQGA